MFYADTFDVQEGATLQIDYGATLEVSNSHNNGGGGAGTDNSVVYSSAEVHLMGGSPSGGGALRFTTHNHNVSGKGEILLEKGSEIDIAYGIQVINELATTGKGIRGKGGFIKHYGTGSILPAFRNEGIVAADEDTPGIDLGQKVSLTDIAAAEWRVDGGGTSQLGVTMVFHLSAGLNGTFVGHCGGVFTGFDIETSYITCGKWIRNGCGVEFEYQGYYDTFTYAGFDPGTCLCGSSYCGNPLAPLPGPTWTLGYAGVGSCGCN